MNNCCQNTYNLCAVSNCSTITFGESLTTENIKIYYTFANITQPNQLEITTGQPYLIDVSKLNENACYNIYAKKTTGEKYQFNIDGTLYDCLKLQTTINYEI